MSGPIRQVTEAAQAFTFSRRAMSLSIAQMGVGALLAGRMAWLSVAENERYKLLSESNRVNLTLIPPRRGWIVDRAGHAIANNRTDFRIDLIPERIEDTTRVLADLARLLKLDPSEVERIARDLEKARGLQPVPVAENLDWDRYAAVVVRQPELPGVAPTQGYARNYPAGAAVAHLVGYVGTPSTSRPVSSSARMGLKSRWNPSCVVRLARAGSR